MKAAFLGTACAQPSAENGYTSILAEAGQKLILIDASGNPIQSILKTGRDPGQLDLLVLTHHHADHIAAFPSLVQSLDCMGRTKELIVVAARSVGEKAQGLLELLEINPRGKGFPINYREDFSAPGLDIHLLPGNHSVPTSMVLLHQDRQGVLYTSDTAYSPRIAEAARDCSSLIHEATASQACLQEQGLQGHSSAYQAGLSAAAAGVERLFLCHICQELYPDGRILEEGRSSFSGRVILPENFRWYAL